MSIGGLIGGIIGGVVGFFTGGIGGAAIGFGIGFGLGTIVDPITPDVPSAGSPEQKLTITTNEIGLPIPDLVGTGKITGNLLCYGNERSEAQWSKSSGGKGGGGSHHQITGYKYYMSWAIGLCAGPVDEIYTIFRNEEAVWSGNLQRPEAGGQETIAITDVGNVTFYFGTDDQEANATVGELISAPTLNTPYRNLCWVFFDDCYIGEYHRMPTMRFILRKSPELPFSTKNVIMEYDYNPIHAIWYIFHNLTGLPVSWLHSDDFTAAADMLYAEYRGISLLFDRQQDALTYLENINSHINNVIRYGNDGKFHPKLIRKDYSLAALPVVDESVMLDEPTITRKSWIDTINEVKVQYSELINVDRESDLPPGIDYPPYLDAKAGHWGGHWGYRFSTSMWDGCSEYEGGLIDYEVTFSQSIPDTYPAGWYYHPLLEGTCICIPEEWIYHPANSECFGPYHWTIFSTESNATWPITDCRTGKYFLCHSAWAQGICPLTGGLWHDDAFTISWKQWVED